MEQHDYQAAAAHYATLSLSELRRYQSITQGQIPLAYRQRQTAALVHLQRVDELVAAAIYAKAFVQKSAMA